MDFNLRNLAVIAYAQGFILWHYRAGSTPLGKVAEAGFFNDAADMFDTGDMILVSAAGAGRVLLVASTEGGVVTAPLT